MPRKHTGGEAAELLETFKKICREAGLKVTHQRLEIFRVLAVANDHPSAEDIYERVRKTVPTISLDTVYRTVTTLEKNGVLGRVQPDARSRFDPNLEVHHHFICTECKRIDDFYWPAFDRMRSPPRRAQWGRVESKRVEIRGVCKACQKRMKEKS
jgi:Fur family peroxide stress response transcriptional regulator